MLALFGTLQYPADMIDVTARAEARGLMGADGPLFPAELECADLILPAPDSPEALILMDAIKPRQYAALGREFDVLLGILDKRKEQYPPFGLVPISGTRIRFVPQAENSFGQLHNTIDRTLRACLDDLQTSPEFEDAAKFTKLIGSLSSIRYSDHILQLMGGIGTTSRNMTMLLRNFSNILMHHAPELEAYSYKAIADQSVGLPLKLAMEDTSQMLAAEEALWQDLAPKDPEHYVLRWRNGVPYSLAYRDFPNLQVPAGFSAHPDIAPLSEPVTVSTYDCGERRIIGCPITLVERKLIELWQWVVEIVEENDLWEAESKYVGRVAAHLH